MKIMQASPTSEIPSHMTALALTDDGPSVDHHYPVPQPTPKEALIRVELAGICATDLALIAGYKGGYRGVLGHEFVGEVVAAPGNETWVGHRVVGEINVGCGTCTLCQRGLSKHCRQRSSLGIINRDGAFAHYITLPVANLHRVPAAISNEAAVFVEPLAAARQILEQVHISPGQRVYLLGTGRLGMLIAQVLACTGCDLTIIGRRADKLALLHDMGIHQTANVATEGLEDLIANPADIVVEATGSPSGFAQAQRLVRPAGTLVLKSTFAGGLPNFDISQLVVDEIQLVGSRCGPFAPALRLLAEGAIQVAPLIHARYPLSESKAAFADASRPGVLKVLLEC